MILAFQNREKIKHFAEGCGATWVDLAGINQNTKWPMIFSGITTNACIAQAKKYGLDWYYIDTGYFGNYKKKNYLRVLKNQIHACGPIIMRPRDRLDKIKIDTSTIDRGKKILIVPPDDKQCLHYGLGSPDLWLDQTQRIVKQFTDRDIEIRQRPKSRSIRSKADRFTDMLRNNINAVVTYISSCAVDSVLHDIPVVSLGPSAACQVCTSGIELIDDLPNIDPDCKESWMKHLSYCQFTEPEMKSGLAWDLLNKV